MHEKVLNATALTTVLMMIVYLQLQECNARVLPKSRVGEKLNSPRSFLAGNAEWRRKKSFFRTINERHNIKADSKRRVRSVPNQRKSSKRTGNALDFKAQVSFIRDPRLEKEFGVAKAVDRSDYNRDKVPQELIAQFGGEVPFEIIQRLAKGAPGRNGRQFGRNLPPEYSNLPSEIVAQFGGNVPSEIVAQFNGRSDENIANQRKTDRADLAPVAFGQFNYDYVLKNPSICDTKKIPIDEDGEGEEEETTTKVPEPEIPPDNNIPLTAEQKEKILREHNKYRDVIQPRAADMRLMTWDDELAWVSQTFSNSCYFRDLVDPESFHPNGSQISPAIELKRHSYLATEIGHTWYAWPSTYKIPKDFATSSVSAWAFEKVFYDSFSQQCDGICEHYLQLIWAETFKLGCSAAWCTAPNINGIVWPQAILLVCSYTPRGGLANFMAANPSVEFFDPKLFIEPYKKGPPCSLCVLNPENPDQKIDEMRSTTDTCWNRLCSNKVRDSLIPFIPPARTTTQMWIMTPAPRTTTQQIIRSTKSTINIDLQFDDDDDGFIVTIGGAVAVQPCLTILLLFSTLLIRLMSSS